MLPRKLIPLLLVAILALFAGVTQNINAGRAQDNPLAPAIPLATSFTYQGILTNSNDDPINDSCDFRFRLYDADTVGAQVGTDQVKTGVTVTRGSFMVTLDFGSAAFTGDARWLEVAVKCSGGADYTPLSPRQPLTAAPYAIYAPAAGNANLLDGQDSTAFASDTHTHWGETWSGTGTGLTLSGGTTGLWASGSSWGVFSYSNSTIGIAVNGYVSSTSGPTSGVLGRSDSSVGYGVYGYAAATSGNTTGVLGVTDSTEGRGVHGFAPSTSGITIGVIGEIRSTEGRGVWGLASATNGNTYGVFGEVQSPDGRGVYGYASATSGNTNGVYGQSDSSQGQGVYGWATATTGTTYGVYGSSSSTTGRGVAAIAAASTGVNYGMRSTTNSPDGWAGWFYSTVGNGMHISAAAGKIGLEVVGGTKNAVVRTSEGSRLLYSEESTSVWFTDYGTGLLQNGTAVLAIDPLFAQTVNLSVPYLAFLTPLGDCGLYVAEKTPTTITVRALDGKNCNLAFDYRIVAKRLGYEDDRLEPAPWADNDPNLYPEKAGEAQADP